MVSLHRPWQSSFRVFKTAQTNELHFHPSFCPKLQTTNGGLTEADFFWQFLLFKVHRHLMWPVLKIFAYSIDASTIREAAAETASKLGHNLRRLRVIFVHSHICCTKLDGLLFLGWWLNASLKFNNLLHPVGAELSSSPCDFPDQLLLQHHRGHFVKVCSG